MKEQVCKVCGITLAVVMALAEFAAPRVKDDHVHEFADAPHGTHVGTYRPASSSLTFAGFGATAAATQPGVIVRLPSPRG